ncbi:MAG: O-antigen ligase [Polaribacter sp.]|jgi:O-antigen ligase
MDWPTGLLLSYFIWSTFSVAWATNFSEAIFESQKGILGFAAFYICRWFQLNDENFISRLLKSIVVVSGVVFLLVCWQMVQVDAGLENVHYEIRGISGHKNLFSTVLFLLAGFLSIAYFKLEKNWRKAAVSFLIVILLLIIYLKTRSVYLALVVIAGVFLFRKLRQQLGTKLAATLSKGIVALFLLGLLGFLYTWQTNQLIPLLQTSSIDQLWQSDTGYERLMLWEKTASVIRQSPFFGVGAGNWQIEYPNYNVHGLYSVELDSTTFQRPHNDWLWVWAETGIIGLLCYLGFFLAIVQAGLHNLKKEILPTYRLALITRLAFIAGFMIIACFSFPKERIEILLLFYTLMGLFYPIESKQNIKSLYWAKLVLVLIILSTALNLYIGKKRMNGEKAMKEVLVLKQQKNWPRLIEASDQAFSKWYTVDPTTIPIHWYRGTAHFILGEQKAALQDFLKAEEYTPFNQHIQNDLGTCYETMGRKEKARGYYKEAIRISPLFDDPRLNLSISYYNNGEYQKALDWVNSIQNHELKMKYRTIILNKQNKAIK